MSVHVVALQDGLRAAYRYARAGLQWEAMHQRHHYDDKVQRLEYQAGDLVWIHNIAIDRDSGVNLLFHGFGPALVTKVLVWPLWEKALSVVHVEKVSQPLPWGNKCTRLGKR